MNKYLPRELTNLKDNKERVMKNVEHSIRGKRQFTMPKIIGSFIVAASIIFISILTYQQLNEKTDTTAEEPVVDVLAPGQYDDLLRTYFPEDQSKKLMFDSVNGEYTVETYWLSENYIKEVTEKANAVTFTYYRIANNKIDIVNENMEQKDYTVVELNKMAAKVTIVEAPFREGHSTGSWTLKNYGDNFNIYKNALIIERDDEEINTTHIMVPKYGHIYTEVTKNSELVNSISMGQLTYGLDGGQMKFDKMEDVEIEPAFHTPWQISPSGKQRLTLLGLGEQGGEEGVGHILIEDIEYNVQTVFSITNVPYNQITPKTMVWIDEERIFVIIGYAHGTVTTGGELYILNIKENTLTPIIEELAIREEISDIKKVSDTSFSYEKFTYLTDMMETSESEVTQGVIQVAQGFVYSVNGDVIEYNLGDKAANDTSKVLLQENNDPRAITLEDVKVDDLIEFVLLDGVIIQMNKVDYSPT